MTTTTQHIQLPARGTVPAANIFTKLYIKDKLGDRNTIILLPGGPGNDMSMYDDPNMSIAQTFFEVADVILFDPRACGQSEPCELQYCSLDHYIDDVEAIREYFELKPEQFFVFGQSYGSFTALGYACRYPNSLKKLLLIGAIANADFYQQAQANLEKIGTAEQIAFAQKLWTGSFSGSSDEVKAFYHLMSPLYSYAFEPGEAPLEISYNLEVMNYGWGEFLKQFDFTPLLKNVTCETLILWGEQEWIVPKEQVDLVCNGISNCQLKTYPECMHMLWIDQWDRFVKDSISFLSGGNVEKQN